MKVMYKVLVKSLKIMKNEFNGMRSEMTLMN